MKATYQVWFVQRPSDRATIPASNRHAAIETFAEREGVIPSAYIQCRMVRHAERMGA